jgi:GTP-binding protein
VAAPSLNFMTTNLPSLVIIGRPNVGKSTLFNRLTGTRRSIVTNEPGITRDRIYGKAEWRGRAMEIVDTGGIVPDDKALIPQEILRQAHVAIKKAAMIVLVVDSQAGLTPLDEELARMPRFSTPSACRYFPSPPNTAPAWTIFSMPRSPRSPSLPP